MVVWLHAGHVGGGWVRLTRQQVCHERIKGGKLQESESSLICFIIAAGSSKPLPVFMNILANNCISVFLHNKNVLLQYLVNDILLLVIEFTYFIVIIV